MGRGERATASSAAASGIQPAPHAPTPRRQDGGYSSRGDGAEGRATRGATTAGRRRGWRGLSPRSVSRRGGCVRKERRLPQEGRRRHRPRRGEAPGRAEGKGPGPAGERGPGEGACPRGDGLRRGGRPGQGPALPPARRQLLPRLPAAARSPSASAGRRCPRVGRRQPSAPQPSAALPARPRPRPPPLAESRPAGRPRPSRPHSGQSPAPSLSPSLPVLDRAWQLPHWLGFNPCPQIPIGFHDLQSFPSVCLIGLLQDHGNSGPAFSPLSPLTQETGLGGEWGWPLFIGCRLVGALSSRAVP